MLVESWDFTSDCMKHETVHTDRAAASQQTGNRRESSKQASQLEEDDFKSAAVETQGHDIHNK